jgi:hypothetical protein
MEIYFAKDCHIDQEKGQRTPKVVESLFAHGDMSIKVENSNEDEICFKSYFIS